MNKNPLISVIIPIYNVQDYLSQCLDSIINQTYKNLEIICIDDETKDNSGKIADNYSKEDKRIKVIHKQNEGTGTTRNHGIKIAKGEYIAFIDSDDFISNNFYQNLINVCNNDDIIMTTNIIHYFENKNNSPKIITGQLIDLTNNKKQLILGSGTCVNKIYKKDFLIKNDIKFYPKTNLIEDNYFTVKAYLFANSIKSIDTSIYYYRMNNNSITHKKLTNKDFICLDIAKGIENYKNLSPEFSKLIDKKISRELGTFYRRLSFPYKKEFKKLFKEKFPNLRIAIRKPLKWVYSKYIEDNTVYYSFLGDRFVIKIKKH